MFTLDVIPICIATNLHGFLGSDVIRLIENYWVIWVRDK
jgi:hypothetical protein